MLIAVMTVIQGRTNHYLHQQHLHNIQMEMLQIVVVEEYFNLQCQTLTIHLLQLPII